jgi:hypothetical protein
MYLLFSQHSRHNSAPASRVITHPNKQSVIGIQNIDIALRIDPIHINRTTIRNIDCISLAWRVIIEIREAPAIVEGLETAGVEKQVR